MKSSQWSKAFKTLVFAFVFSLFFGSLPSKVYANENTMLITPIVVNASSNFNHIKARFEAELERSLKSKGFIVKRTSTTPRTTQSAQALVQTNKSGAILSGNVSQIGDTFSINISYVNIAGKMKPIQFEVPTNSTLASITDEIAFQATQTADIAPIVYGGISDILVEGTRALDPEVVIARMDLSRGDIPTNESLNNDVRRIWDTGYFEDVQAKMIKQDGEDVLLITVKERPRIDEVVVNGSDAVSLSDILETMTSRTGSVLNDKVLVDDIQRVTELYRSKGYYNAKVKYEVITRANGTAALAFNVDEGNKLYIEEIIFNGLSQLDKDELEKYLSLKTRGFFSFITGTGVLKEEDLARDAQTIAAFAVNEGYINAQVDDPEVTYSDTGIIITYTIQEGDRFALGTIDFAGNLIADPDVFYEIIKLDEWKEENTYFSLNTMQEDLRALTTYYNDQGYAFAQVIPQDSVDPEAKTIGITFNLEPEAKVHINRVDVSGNYETRDNVILREMRLADGDRFSGSQIARSQERLMKTDYFEEVNVNVLPTEDPTLVNLDVEVVEGNTGTLTGGVGYSTYDGVGVSAGISQNNLFGRGYNIGVNGYISQKEMNMTGHFWNPRLYDTNIGAGITLYGITQEWIDYDRDTIGGRLNFSYPLGEYTHLNWGYRLENYNIYNLNNNAAPSIQDYEGNNWASVVNVGIVRDTTDANFYATRGTKTSLDIEYGGSFLGGSDDFVSVEFETGGYFQLAENHILHARGTVGGVFQNTSKVVPSFERFYIGGMNTIRGYDYEDISPIDRRTGESIGADRMAYASLEYIWTFETDLGLALVPFFDIAVATDSSYESFFARRYYSAGVELRWQSPMGDLRFAYGMPLSENVQGEKRSSGRFEFTIGSAF